ncbi:MAG: hypothetical protein V4615_17580 [Bacteroidota bacterium]
MKSSYVPFFVFTGIIAFFLIAFIVNRNMGSDDEEENADDTGSEDNNGQNT